MHRIEWEGLQENINFKGFGVDNFPEFFPKSIDNLGIENIEIFRDENCRIKCKINFKDSNFEEYVKLSDISRSTQWNMDFYDYPKQQLLLKNCKGETISGMSENYEFLISSDSMQRIFSEKSVEWLTEWYINGPKYLYTRWTSRILDFTYERLRHDLGNTNSIFKSHPKKIEGHDYMFIEFKDKNDVCFIIHSVPDFYNPQWSQKLGIEYRTEWNIPNQNERKKISEIVSFLFGRQLINIGQTKFDGEGQPIEELLITPIIDPEINLKNLSKNQQINPINYNIPPSIYPDIGSIETQLNKFIPLYIDKRDKLCLDEVFRRYWLSQSLPSYSRLIILAGGFELLSACWHESYESKSKGKFLPSNMFKNLFKDDLKSIKDKLNKLECEKDCDDFDKNKERIYQKMFELNNMGTKASIINFLNEINLKIGEVEEKAILCRNEPAHGNILNTNEFEKLKNYEEAYRTLFNRAILKILGYEGDYIDYFSDTNVTRPINEPIGNKVNTKQKSQKF